MKNLVALIETYLKLFTLQYSAIADMNYYKTDQNNKPIQVNAVEIAGNFDVESQLANLEERDIILYLDNGILRPTLDLSSRSNTGIDKQYEKEANDVGRKVTLKTLSGMQAFNNALVDTAIEKAGNISNKAFASMDKTYKEKFINMYLKMISEDLEGSFYACFSNKGNLFSDLPVNKIKKHYPDILILQVSLIKDDQKMVNLSGLNALMTDMHKYLEEHNT